MSAEALLTRFYRQGVHLRVDGDKVRWQAPAGVLSDADLAQLRDHKAEVSGILRDAEADALEERAALIHEGHTQSLADGGAPLGEPVFHMTRAEAERLALADVTGGAT